MHAQARSQSRPSRATLPRERLEATSSLIPRSNEGERPSCKDDTHLHNTVNGGKNFCDATFVKILNISDVPAWHGGLFRTCPEIMVHTEKTQHRHSEDRRRFPPRKLASQIEGQELTRSEGDPIFLLAVYSKDSRRNCALLCCEIFMAPIQLREIDSGPSNLNAKSLSLLSRCLEQR